MDNLSSGDFPSHWKAPDQGGFKFNCDIAVAKGVQDAAFAVVQRNWEGQIVNGFASLIKVTSPLQGELLAIRFACCMMKSQSINDGSIESDCQTAIKLSVSELVPPWEVATVVDDIKQMQQESGVTLAWIKRKANGLAHILAKKKLCGLLPLSSWVANPPPFVISVLDRDFISRL